MPSIYPHAHMIIIVVVVIIICIGHHKISHMVDFHLCIILGAWWERNIACKVILGRVGFRLYRWYIVLSLSRPPSSNAVIICIVRGTLNIYLSFLVNSTRMFFLKTFFFMNTWILVMRLTWGSEPKLFILIVYLGQLTGIWVLFRVW